MYLVSIDSSLVRLPFTNVFFKIFLIKLRFILLFSTGDVRMSAPIDEYVTHTSHVVSAESLCDATRALLHSQYDTYGFVMDCPMLQHCQICISNILHYDVHTLFHSFM